jgi:hypothetical protein
MSEPPSRTVNNVLSCYRYCLFFLVIGGGLGLSSAGLQILLMSSPLSLMTKEEPGRQKQGTAGGNGGDRGGGMMTKSPSSVVNTNESSSPTASTIATRNIVGDWLGQTWVLPLATVWSY